MGSTSSCYGRGMCTNLVHAVLVLPPELLGDVLLGVVPGERLVAEHLERSVGQRLLQHLLLGRGVSRRLIGGTRGALMMLHENDCHLSGRGLPLVMYRVVHLVGYLDWIRLIVKCHHLADFLSQSCQSSGRTRQRAEEPKPKPIQPSYPTRWTTM